eukprot:COSAG02_NODE_5622_length_4175_cov_13.084642_2_plen_461_part_00
MHVNVVNAQPTTFNLQDPVGGFAGIPRNMTTVAQVMKRAGYSTHMIGKWDAGMATPTHTPAGRGYDSTLIYFSHANDYYTFRDGNVCHNSTPGVDVTGSGIKDIINYGNGECGVSGWAGFVSAGHLSVYVQLSIDGTPYGSRQEANISRPKAPKHPGFNGWKFQLPCDRISSGGQHNLTVAAFATSASTLVAWSTTACATNAQVIPCAPDTQENRPRLDTGKVGPVDMWNYPPGGQAGIPRMGRPGYEYVNSPSCTDESQNVSAGEKCQYEDEVFEARVQRIISWYTDKVANTSNDEPLFIFWAPHIVHGPLQVPDVQLARFDFIDQPDRQAYHAMVNWIDTAIGRVIQSLKDAGLWENTLLSLNADNGGPLDKGANNFPLKGGKVSVASLANIVVVALGPCAAEIVDIVGTVCLSHTRLCMQFSNWEGGIRVNALVSGGWLPAHAHGSIARGFVTAWDW